VIRAKGATLAENWTVIVLQQVGEQPKLAAKDGPAEVKQRQLWELDPTSSDGACTNSFLGGGSLPAAVLLVCFTVALPVEPAIKNLVRSFRSLAPGHDRSIGRPSSGRDTWARS
jgi:hypothetical protein